jgi:hypothetical protein
LGADSGRFAPGFGCFPGAGGPGFGFGLNAEEIVIAE